MDVARRLKLGLLAVVALFGATMVMSTVAQARTIPDPMLSNVPYLAWRGQEVRLVKCSPDFPSFAGGANVDFNLVDWSGDPHLAQPVMEAGTLIEGVRSFDGAQCFGVDFVSQKAGLAVIKMTVSTGGGVKIDTHDFLVAWMNLNSIVLCNNSAPGFCTGPTTATITDQAGGTPNILETNITGNIPLLQDFNEIPGLAHPITLPDGSTAPGLVMPTDWALLASKVATFRGTANPAQFWDIHDDELATEGHAQEAPGICTPRVNTGIDAVDQCTDPGAINAANERGPFSSIYLFPSGNGLSCLPTYGPFDPTRACETELSDGKVDAGDAPMPAARIDFSIAPNSGAATDISGVGTLMKVDKGLCPGQSALNDLSGDETNAGFNNGCINSLYVRPGGSTPHHLYAPFYRTYLPATNAPGDPFSSGIDDFLSNNFNGFLNLTGNALADRSGLYDYWDIAEILGTTEATATNCLFRTFNGVPAFLQTPGNGPNSVVVYSDEHGEARTAFNPGTGFFFDNLVPVSNANLGCDLAGIATLGTASITATARYPFEPVTAQPLVSNTVAKSVASLFVKLIQCFPKGPTAFDQQVAVCVAHAQDIAGHAITGERVCFFASGAEGLFLPTLSSITIPGQTTWPAIAINPAPSLAGPNNVCAFTDVNGNTAVEVADSDAETVNVMAFFVDEGLFRSVHVKFPITAPTVASTGPVAASTGASGGSTPQSSTQVPVAGSKPGTTVSSSHTDSTVKVRHKVALARLHGKVLSVKLTGPKGHAMLAITAMTKAKTLSTTVRSVRANKIVKLRLKIPSGVKKLRLSVMPS